MKTRKPIRATLVAIGVGALVLGGVGIANAATSDPAPTLTVVGAYVDNVCQFNISWTGAVNDPSFGIFDPVGSAEPALSGAFTSESGSLDPWPASGDSIAIALNGGDAVVYSCVKPTDPPVVVTPPPAVTPVPEAVPAKVDAD